jgi:FAD-dependent oxidoreductase domain-containing protein 1
LKDYDVVVVGAGIIGIASAYHIQKNNPGKKVLVLDRLGDAGQANTGRSNAMFRNTFTSTDNQVLADSAIDFYFHVQNELGADIGVDPLGYLWLMNERRLSASEGHLSKMVDNGIELRRYDRRELETLLPAMVTRPTSEQAALMGLEDAAAGIFGPKCGRLAPEKLVGFYRDRFLGLGGKVMFNSEAKQLLVEPSTSTGIEGEPFVWQEARVAGLRLSEGTELRAGTVVVTAGAWTNELLDPAGIDGHAKAKKRQLFALSAKGSEPLERLLWTKGFSASGTLPFVILPKTGLFVKAVKETGEFWVGCEDELNRPFISVPDHDLDAYPAEPRYYEMNIYQVLREYFPQFEGARPARMWAGLYAYNTLDNLPYVFSGEGLVVAGGDSGSGVMKGDSLGRIVEAVYRDGEDAEAELYGGRRYRASKLGFRHRDVEREEWIL